MSTRPEAEGATAPRCRAGTILGLCIVLVIYSYVRVYDAAIYLEVRKAPRHAVCGRALSFWALTGGALPRYCRAPNPRSQRPPRRTCSSGRSRTASSWWVAPNCGAHQPGQRRWERGQKP